MSFLIIVLSPSKRLDFEAAGVRKHTQPAFLDDAQKLVGRMKKLSAADLQRMMGVSQKVADLNVARYREWKKPFTPGNAKQALLAFRGDVYLGLAAESFGAADLDFAQRHVRVLSGLYGVLKPLDLIQPYRLEMGVKLPDGAAAGRARAAGKPGVSLYDFWGDKITEQLNGDFGRGEAVLVNLASNEYFRAIRPRRLKARVVTPVFKEKKNGRYKVISFTAKRSRGMMASWIVKNRVRDVAAIKRFCEGGYAFDARLSDETDWVFTRG